MLNLKTFGGIAHHYQQHERLKYFLLAAIPFKTVFFEKKLVADSFNGTDLSSADVPAERRRAISKWTGRLRRRERRSKKIVRRGYREQQRNGNKRQQNRRGCSFNSTGGEEVLISSFNHFKDLDPAVFDYLLSLVRKLDFFFLRQGLLLILYCI